MATPKKKKLTKPTPKVLQGRPLRDFVARCKQGVSTCNADREYREAATENLDFVVKKIGYWKIRETGHVGSVDLPVSDLFHHKVKIF